jgi:heat shock protein HtpX
MNLFEQQALNRRRTWIVMGLFVILVLLLGAGFDAAAFSSQGVALPIGTGVALLYGFSTSAYSYFRGDRAVLASTRAVPLADAINRAPDRLEYRQLENVVDEMTIASGLPRPKVFIVADKDPNAFATGRDPEHASIAVTEGLLSSLNREQLQGVVAHEMSHIRNYDIRLMTMVAALVGAVALLSDWAARGMRFGLFGGKSSGSSRGSSKKDGGGIVAVVVMAIWLLAIIVAPIVARILAMTVSRRREFLADATAAELTRNPSALADALERLEGHTAPTIAVNQGSAHLCIADPLGRPVNEKRGWWANLLATHPPMHERVEALRTMAYQRSG